MGSTAARSSATLAPWTRLESGARESPSSSGVTSLGYRTSDRVVVPGGLVWVLAGVATGIHVDDGRVEPANLMEQAMADLLGDLVALCDRHVTVDRDRHGGLERMAQPSDAEAVYRLDIRHRRRDLLDLRDDVRFDRIHESPEHLARGLLEDDQDDPRNQQPNERIGQRIASRDPNSAGDDRE